MNYIRKQTDIEINLFINLNLLEEVNWEMIKEINLVVDNNS